MSQTPAVSAIHVPEQSNERERRRKLLFFDRAKVLLLLGAFVALAIVSTHGETPLTSWGDAANQQLRAKWLILVLMGLEFVRQLHNYASEKSGDYNYFWSHKIFGGWDRFMSRRNAWLRFRLQRSVKFWITVLVLNAFLAKAWHKQFFENFAYAPSRLLKVMFGPIQGLPLIFTLIEQLTFSIGSIFLLYWAMSKGGADVLSPDEVRERFSDVWGQDKVVSKVQEVVKFLEKPEEIEKKGGYVPGGILLWGPPGTGKTLIAKAVAGETGKPFVFVDPGAFQNMFMGVGILKVKALFRKLRKLALRHNGVIVFFDEADSLGSRGGVAGTSTAKATRSSGSCNGHHYASHQTAAFLRNLETETAPAANEEPVSGIARIIVGGMGGGGMGTLQALLTELSGMEKPRGFVARRVRKFLCMPGKKPPKYRILMVMATNLPDALDAALLRPGRIDRQFKVDYPTLEGRIRTFEGYLNKVKHNVTATQIERLALTSTRQSGAVIKDLVNEAVISALRENRDVVEWNDMLAARMLKVHGMSDGAHSVSLERHRTAIHEAGHAVAMKTLKKRQMIDIATIEQRGDVGGFVAPVPLEEMSFPWKYDQECDVIMFMASLAAERHFFAGDNSVGVGGDMRSWTSIVSSMVAGAAMGDTLANPNAYFMNKGDATYGAFDAQVETKLRELFDRARKLIIENEVQLMAISHALETHHTIFGEDINAIYEGTKGPLVDGAWYASEEFEFLYRRFHAAALQAHMNETKLDAPFPTAGTVVVVTGDSYPHAAPAELGVGSKASESSSPVIDIGPAE